MVKTITKKMAIKAVSNEPLVAGSWFHLKDYLKDGESYREYISRSSNKKELQTCSVCAVGAILRLSSFTTSPDHIDTWKNNKKGDGDSSAFYYGVTDNSWYPFDNSDYLMQLSSLFEYLCKNIGLNMIQIRMELVNFIEATFPDTIKIEL